MEKTEDFLIEFQMAQRDLIRSVQSSESIERLKLENEQNHQIMQFLGNEHQQTVQELTEMVEELFLKDQVENEEDSMRREIIKIEKQNRAEIDSYLKTQQRLKSDDNWNQLNVQLLEDEVYEMSERIETLSNLKRQSDDLNLMKNRKITDLESRVKELESEVSDLQERLDAEFDNEADVLDILKDFYFSDIVNEAAFTLNITENQRDAEWANLMRNYSDFRYDSEMTRFMELNRQYSHDRTVMLGMVGWIVVVLAWLLKGVLSSS